MQKIRRPGFFGRRRDEKIAALSAEFGVGGWDLRWFMEGVLVGLSFNDACITFYESSYLAWFRDHPEELDFVCSFGEIIDNAPTNVQSGLGLVFHMQNSSISPGNQ